MTSIEVGSSQPNCSLPKFIAPRQSGDTRSPDRPRVRNPCEAMLATPSSGPMTDLAPLGPFARHALATAPRMAAYRMRASESSCRRVGARAPLDPVETAGGTKSALGTSASRRLALTTILTKSASVQGKHLLGTDNAKLGAVREIFVDLGKGDVPFVVIEAASLLG